MKQYKDTKYYITRRGKVWDSEACRYLKTGIAETGPGGAYEVVNLKDGSGKLGYRIYYIHRLLGECFLPRDEGDSYVMHKNGNTLDNSLMNLKWGTPTESISRAIRRFGGREKWSAEMSSHLLKMGKCDLCGEKMRNHRITYHKKTSCKELH